MSGGVRTVLALTLFASFVLLSGALPPRAESTRTPVVACATLSRPARCSEVVHAAPRFTLGRGASVAVREPVVDARRAPPVPRFLRHRALLN